MAELAVHGGHDDVDVGDAAVGDEDLLAVEHPLVAVADGGGAQGLDVGAGLRLGHGVGAGADLVPGAEDEGQPLAHLLGRGRGGDAGGGQRRGGDGQRDARAAPVELLGVDHAELTASRPWPSSAAGRTRGGRGRGPRGSPPTARSGRGRAEPRPGRMTSSAKRWQWAWNSRTSSERLKSMPGLYCSPAFI